MTPVGVADVWRICCSNRGVRYGIIGFAVIKYEVGSLNELGSPLSGVYHARELVWQESVNGHMRS
jgi:hypothetical protein